MNDQSTAKLIRTVGFWGLVAMCINAVIGSGVFLLPYESYKLLGAFSLWAPLLFAVPVFILALNFAEAASHFSEPGGAYLYAKTALGDFIGFETGWMNWIARLTSLASLSNGFVVALALLFPMLKTGMPRAMVIIASIVILAVIHLLGVRYGAASIYIFTFGKLLPLIGFIIVALLVWKTNPIPGSFDVPAAANWGEVALFMLFAYAGFENLGVPAGEYKNPRRDLPLALLLGIFIIAVIYVLVQLGAMSALPDLSQTDTPIASAASAIVGPIGALIVTLGAVLSMAGTNSGTMLEGSRMLYALSLGRRGLGAISYVHPRFRTPTIAIAIHASIALAMALAGSFRTLALISAGARLVTYLMTCIAVPRLRKLSPTSDKGFRTPGLIIPILGVIVSLVFVITMVQEPKRVLALGIGLVVGSVLYVLTRTSSNKP